MEIVHHHRRTIPNQKEEEEKKMLKILCIKNIFDLECKLVVVVLCFTSMSLELRKFLCVFPFKEKLL
jgi:hypothetical protein